MKYLFLTALLSLEVLAWGPTGHRVVGDVAEKHLRPDIKLKIAQILDGNSLSRVANWPDEIKSEPETYTYTYNWHHTDWADEAHEHNESASSGKLLVSIQEQTNVLKNPESSKEKKAFAIKFLTHLVGDLHQPLHVGNGLDRGGNNCKVYFHNKLITLHILWDEAMIDFTKLSFSELSLYLTQGISAQDVKLGSVMEWAEESKMLRNTVYPAEITPSQQSVKQYCRKDITVASEEIPKLSYEYSYKFMPVVEKRLFMGGVRLAYLLNEALK